MEKQPAKINYFFGQCYRDLGDTIGNTFANIGDSVRNCAEHIGDAGEDGGWATPLGIIKIGFWLGLLVCTCIISTLLCIVCSLVHIVFTILMMTFIYLWFSFLWVLDWITRRFHKIVSGCPNCQRKFALPYYRCSNCGQLHTKLIPSKYGILKRQCECGAKLPTTFLNGRQKLDAICPFCNTPIKGGGFHVNVSIPVIGGPSAGKTCFINMALSELEKMADAELGYAYEHIDDGTDPLDMNLQIMANGHLPMKTSDMRLVYYNFYFSPKKSKVRNQISICDVGGEVYEDSTALNDQIGYNFANGYLLVIDPLSIEAFRKEFEQSGSPYEFGMSSKPIDEVLDILIQTLDNMRNASAKSKITQSLAIVFTKCDMPLIAEKIGEDAVRAFAAGDKKCTLFEARNVLCERFLMEYDEAGFVHTVNGKFGHVQYFTCSALGHNMNGDAFTPDGVADPILWLIDKQSPTINFKDRWSKTV